MKMIGMKGGERMENIHQSIKIDDTIQEILEKLKNSLNFIKDQYHIYDLYHYLSYHGDIFLIPSGTGMKITLSSKGGQWNHYHYSNIKEISFLDIKNKPVYYSWKVEHSCCDYDIFDELIKIYEDDTIIAVLYLCHHKDIISDNPVQFEDVIYDPAIYIYFKE